MEAIGQLAGGIAHDFNNLLQIIGGYAQLLLGSLGEDDPARESVEPIAEAAERATSLTRQLLAFSRRQVLEPKVLDLNAVVTDTEAMLRRLIGEDIALESVLAAGLGRVRADRGQIEQVIVNLALNARGAMPPGGRLTIETANAQLDEAYARLHPPLEPGPYVLLAVSDGGFGMDAETQSHIFEPFFTTKDHGEGSGLGLATVYGVVKQSGGYVWVYSVPGQGSTFKIYLPRVDDPLEPSRPPARRLEAPRGSETILLVEDEEAVRELAREILERLGYTVLAARDGVEALALCARRRGDVHLIVTDVVMPGMGGSETADRLLELSSAQTKVLYMSGYAEEAVIRHGVLRPGSAFLQKPFTVDGLARKVRELLNAPG